LRIFGGLFFKASAYELMSGPAGDASGPAGDAQPSGYSICNRMRKGSLKCSYIPLFIKCSFFVGYPLSGAIEIGICARCIINKKRQFYMQSSIGCVPSLNAFLLRKLIGGLKGRIA
jgi:hypothetical protein